MKKWIQFAACLLNLSLSANEPQAPDEDLFRKDEQVCSGHVEFLYWTLEEGSLDYALKMKSPAWGSPDSTLNFASGNFETAGYGFDPGFRVAFSFYRAPRFWEVKWQYTRMTVRGSDHAEAPEGAGEFLTGTWPQIVSGSLQEARSRLHFNYNILDMALARVFNPNPHLRIRFIGGVTSAWMSQQWIVRYINTASETTRIDNRWTYAAGGLKLGTTVDWYWTDWSPIDGFYITATGYAAILMGSYHNRAKQTASAPPPSPAIGTYTAGVPLRNTKLENIRPAFTAQLSVGPSWQRNFCRARMELFAGYEITLWTNLQEMYRSTAGLPNAAKETLINTSALALHGVSARVSVDF